MRSAEVFQDERLPEVCGVAGAISILRLPWWATGGRAPVEALVVLRPEPSRFMDGEPAGHEFLWRNMLLRSFGHNPR